MPEEPQGKGCDSLSLGQVAMVRRLLVTFVRLGSALYSGPLFGQDIGIALDVAASNLYRSDERPYEFAVEGRRFTSEAIADLLVQWCSRYAIVSIEDPMADEDRLGWKIISEWLG
jgi:enolase